MATQQITLELPEELIQAMEARVAEGQYASVSEALLNQVWSFYTDEQALAKTLQERTEELRAILRRPRSEMLSFEQMMADHEAHMSALENS